MESMILIIVIITLVLLDLILTMRIFDLSPCTAVELNPVYGKTPTKQDILKLGIVYRTIFTIILMMLGLFIHHPYLAKLFYAMAGYFISVDLKNWFVVRHLLRKT